MQYPSTPKNFQTFDSLKQLQYDGNILTPEEISGLYWDHTKVIVEMADAYNVFMHTKLGFPLVSVPLYLPNMHELERNDVRKIEDTPFTEGRRVESEVLVIMDKLQENQGQQDLSNASFCSSFSRIQSDELNDMGYGLNRISSITFEGDVFQTPNNWTQGRAPTSTPRKQE